jgi:hypothetical protein
VQDVLRTVGAGEVFPVPGLRCALTEASRFQEDESDGSVTARREAGLAPPLPRRQVEEVDGLLLSVGTANSLTSQAGPALLPRLPGSSQTTPAEPSLRRFALASPRPCRTGSFKKLTAS